MLKKGFLGWLKLNMNYLFFRVKYINEDNLKLIDKAVVCPNHSHAFDPFWVYFKVPNTTPEQTWIFHFKFFNF